MSPLSWPHGRVVRTVDYHGGNSGFDSHSESGGPDGRAAYVGLSTVTFFPHVSSLIPPFQHCPISHQLSWKDQKRGQKPAKHLQKNVTACLDVRRWENGAGCKIQETSFKISLYCLSSRLHKGSAMGVDLWINPAFSLRSTNASWIDGWMSPSWLVDRWSWIRILIDRWNFWGDWLENNGPVSQSHKSWLQIRRDNMSGNINNALTGCLFSSGVRSCD